MGRRIDFYFDLSSPYSYMAATQLDAISQRTGAELRWVPVVLGAVFKATGNGMPAQIPAKAKWMLGDLHRWAAHYRVPFTFNSHFPVNAIKAHRMIVASQGDAARLGRALFDAVWAHDRDITIDAELVQISDAVGLPGATLLAACDTASVKDALRANTDEALGRGMFGAPAFFVDGQLFWGNDRLDFVEAAAK